MQNIINFDVRENCVCSCVCNIHNDSETINLFFEADEYDSPQVEISIIGKTTTTAVYDLEVVNGYAVYNLDHTIFTTAERISIKYIDGSKAGTLFYFSKTAQTYSTSRTMRVNKVSDDTFKIEFIARYKRQVNNVSSDDFEIDDGGELKLKSPIEIKATKTNDVVSNVTLIYKKATETEVADQKSYNCTYDADGNLTKFGDLPITWNGV